MALRIGLDGVSSAAGPMHCNGGGGTRLGTDVNEASRLTVNDPALV
jgi:hypothetical protein